MSEMSPAKRLRELLASGDVVVAGGVYDGLTAAGCQAAGFQAAVISGGYGSMSRGMPNRGLITLTEMANLVDVVTRAAQIPMIADGDIGYGNVANVQRCIRDFEKAGAAGIFIEDQDDDPKCGYALQTIGLVSPEEFSEKIRAACDARSSEDFVIIARSDALHVNGWDDLEKRARMYLDAGADLFFADGVQPEDVKPYGERFAMQGIPTVYNGMAVPLDELRKYGFAMQFALKAMIAGFQAYYRFSVATVSGKQLTDEELPTLYDIFNMLGDAKLDEVFAKFSVN